MASDDPLPQYDFLAGSVLLIDKPLDWTSFDVVNKIRYKLKQLLGIKKIKVGHAGTLDPLATGLLIVCTGKATKQINNYQGLYKIYTGEFTVGGTTPSYDMETEVEETFPTEHINGELLEQARQSFMGDIQQLPPMFSAIKVDGVPLYRHARQGIKVEVKPRPVHIYDFDLLNVELPKVGFKIKCSKGTYIRSLAYDYGRAVRSGAYLSGLRRTHIGEYSVDDAWNLEEFIQYLEDCKPDVLE